MATATEEVNFVLYLMLMIYFTFIRIYFMLNLLPGHKLLFLLRNFLFWFGTICFFQ